MKLYMIRKTLEDGTKEYASAGMHFSSKSSKGWGRIGNLKNAILCRMYNFSNGIDHSFEYFTKWINWETKEGVHTLAILEIDIDNVSITETPISIWYEQNMKPEEK